MTHLRNLLEAIHSEAVFNVMVNENGEIADYWYTPAEWAELEANGRVTPVIMANGKRGYRVNKGAGGG